MFIPSYKLIDFEDFFPTYIFIPPYIFSDFWCSISPYSIQYTLYIIQVPQIELFENWNILLQIGK